MPSLNAKLDHDRNSDIEAEEDDIDIEKLVTDLLKSKSNSNLLCDILRYLQSDDLDDEEMTLGFIGCEKWFSEQILTGVFKSTKQASKLAFQQWVSAQLKSFIAICCQKAKDPSLADLLFPLLLRLYLMEIDNKTKNIEKTRITRLIAAEICNFENDSTEATEKFGDYLCHPNILLDVSNGIGEILDKKKDRNELLASNMIFYVETVATIFPNPEMDHTVVSEKSIKNSLQRLVTSFLRYPLTEHSTKRVLNIIPQLFVCLQDPLLLADYFTSCYNSENNGIALLALNAIYQLMTGYKFEYPEFFVKLYRILTDEVIFSPHRVRFYHMLDQFLASPLLPLSYQAAFTKRLARQTLLAPAPVILILLPLILNQIRRNQALRHLINASKDLTLESDPYEHENEDLNECKALESSLWEIETLRRHFLPEVKRAANQITKSLGRDDSQLPVDITYQKMTDGILKGIKETDTFPLNIDKPKCFVTDELFVE